MYEPICGDSQFNNTIEAGSNHPALYRIHMNKVLTPSILGAFNSLFGGQRTRAKLSPHFIALHLPFSMALMIVLNVENWVHWKAFIQIMLRVSTSNMFRYTISKM